MKRKFLGLIVTIVMVTNVEATCFASGINASHDYIPECYGVLTSDDGEQYFIKGDLVSAPSRQSVGGNERNTITYKYDIPASPDMEVLHDRIVQGNDGAIASTVYLTVEYSLRGIPEECLLTGVSGYWIISDSRVTVSSAYVAYECISILEGITQLKYNRPVSNHFALDSGFTQYVTATIMSSVEARLTVNYLMGNTREWSFTLCNDIIAYTLE